MGSLLEKIDSPEDLRSLSIEQLTRLAAELREEIVRVVSQTGGHLAANLGVVELTLALHRVFSAPRDKIVWDVGHQAYIHKLLTGRRDRFPTLRCYGGISGFPKRDESEYDCFGTGHASTSISAALGMVAARDLAGEDYRVVAVIGDGALTGGMAFEAMNHCGQLGKDLIVVVNDNEMSIAPNVGAMSAYLTKLRLAPTTERAKRDLKAVISRIPALGDPVWRAMERVKGGVKYLLVPGMLFEELGFTYYGPLDGHNLSTLINTFREVRHQKGPIVVHVVTHKGKGYKPAESNPEKFHGTNPFIVETGSEAEPQGGTSYTSVFGKTLVELAKKDERIVAITAAMPEGTGLKQFAACFPNRFFDVGIAEQHAVTFAAGLAAQGLKPVVAIYSTFLQRAYDQLIHDVCLQRLPVTFAVDRAGLVGQDGPTHHGAFDLTYLRAVPNLVVMAPKDEPELQRMMATALALDGPAAIRYPRGVGPGNALLDDPKPLDVGRGEVLREGTDVAIIGIGEMVQTALKAAELLAKDGIEARVVNARFAHPMDAALLKDTAARIQRIVTIEENTVQGGFGSGVLEILADQSDVRVLCLGLPDAFMGHGTMLELRRDAGLVPEEVAGRVKAWLGRE